MQHLIINIIKFKKQKRWVEQLSERSFLLDNIFKLAKIMAPSFFGYQIYMILIQKIRYIRKMYKILIFHY